MVTQRPSDIRMIWNQKLVVRFSRPSYAFPVPTQVLTRHGSTSPPSFRWELLCDGSCYWLVLNIGKFLKCWRQWVRSVGLRLWARKITQRFQKWSPEKIISKSWFLQFLGAGDLISWIISLGSGQEMNAVGCMKPYQHNSQELLSLLKG